MITQPAIPIPPLNLREMVGSPELEFFDNPTGTLLYPHLPLNVYDAVFDFGCGCGRIARLLMQQKEHRPRRYVGIDVHRGLIGWCIENLAPIAPNFQFFHHDVWSPSYGRSNSPRLAEPFPVEDEAFTLCIANSVFRTGQLLTVAVEPPEPLIARGWNASSGKNATAISRAILTHLYKEQAEYYLYEIMRILAPNGIAATSWFFFDNDSFPFFHGGISTLFTSEIDPTVAVIYDRQWFLNTVRKCGLAVRRTQSPPVAGHQWWVELERRTATSVDHFPLGDEDAEWLCGATHKPIAAPVISQEEIQKHKVAQSVPTTDPKDFQGRREPPPLTGAMAELAATQAELATAQAELTMAQAELTMAQAELARIKSSWGWKLAEKVMKRCQMIKKV